MIVNLYDKTPESWDTIAKYGYPEFREVAKMFARYSDMDNALGFSKASNRWATQGCMPSSDAVHKVRMFLSEVKQKEPKQVTSEERIEAQQPKRPDTYPKMPIEQPLLLISGSKASLKKLEGIAKMLGCESVEI